MPRIAASLKSTLGNEHFSSAQNLTSIYTRKEILLDYLCDPEGRVRVQEEMHHPQYHAHCMH